MEGNLFAIIDERKHQIYVVVIDSDIQRLDVEGAPQLGLSFLQYGNFGFEGLTRDKTSHRIFVAKEKKAARF